MKLAITRFLKDESAAVSIEYCIIGGLIGVLLVISLTTIGTKMNTNFQATSDGLS